MLEKRFKPKSFKEFVGNQSIVEFLKNIHTKGAVKKILFSGPEGVGKDTLVHLFALSIGCLSGKPDPCFQCKNCLVPYSNIIRCDPILEDLQYIFEKETSALYENNILYFPKAHLASSEVQRYLVSILHQPRSSYFIATTESPNLLEPEFRLLCMELPFKLVSNKEMVELLKTALALEQISYAEETLSPIVSNALGKPVIALRIIEALAADSKTIGLTKLKQYFKLDIKIKLLEILAEAKVDVKYGFSTLETILQQESPKDVSFTFFQILMELEKYRMGIDTYQIAEEQVLADRIVNFWGQDLLIPALDFYISRSRRDSADEVLCDYLLLSAKLRIGDFTTKRLKAAPQKIDTADDKFHQILEQRAVKIYSDEKPIKVPEKQIPKPTQITETKKFPVIPVEIHKSIEEFVSGLGGKILKKLG